MHKLLSVLAARKDSKYLAKFLARYEATTSSANLRVMVSAQDSWNTDIISLFEGRDTTGPSYEFLFENRGLGRKGLHLYYEDLYEGQEFDWLIYFCEDHSIEVFDWDTIILDVLDNFDPSKPYIAVPGWDNIGAMNHVVSRGFIEAMGGRLAGHGNLDSFLNFVADRIPSRQVVRLPVLFHDYTHDVPSMMDESRSVVALSAEGLALPDFFSEEVQKDIEQCALLVREAGQ